MKGFLHEVLLIWDPKRVSVTGVLVGGTVRFLGEVLGGDRRRGVTLVEKETKQDTHRQGRCVRETIRVFTV